MVAFPGLFVVLAVVMGCLEIAAPVGMRPGFSGRGWGRRNEGMKE
jgi:uncharacterized membrane protein